MAATGVHYTRAALSDLRRIHSFLAPRNKQAADRAVRAVRDAVRGLLAFPESGRPVGNGDAALRELLVSFGRGGYIVLYGLDGSDVVVLSVRHMREAGY